MLNTLVNNTGKGLCNQTSAYYKQSCIDEIFECIGTVACQTDMNTEALEQIHDNLHTTNISSTNVLADSVCTNSVCANAISSVGIEANNVQSQCMNVDGKATVGSLESNGTVKAGSVQTESISTENITGLQSLTVDGCVWADAVDTDALEVNGKAVAECIETDEVSTERLKSDTISTSTIGADTVVSDCFMGANANIQKACIGSLSTSNFSSDEISTSKINSTSLSIPKAETSGGITGKGVIDVTSPVWKEIKIPLFTGTIQFYTDEWKVTINGGREFTWEDPSLDHLKFISNDGETVTVVVDWDGDVYYTYNVAKEEPVISLSDNTGHTPDDDHTYIMQDSGIPRGTVYIYQDKEFTNQGLTILGKVKASNLEITCGESIDCLSVGDLCVSNSIISDNPIEVDICARSFCVSSPCTYIDNCLYADHLEANCICANRELWTKHLYYDMIQMVNCAEKPKSVVVYENGLLCDSYKVCVDDDTVYSEKSCACDFYGNLHGKADNSCCFDGRLFCDACYEILSGKACTAGLADNSCCFDGRTFAKACNEILSGKACKAELADFAQRTCIWCRWGEDDPACYGYIPFADYRDKCLFFGRADGNMMANPFIVYDYYGLVCMELRGCLCLKDRPLIVSDSIDSDYMHTGYLKVKQDALITKLCSCNDYTKQLCVYGCSKFRGPVYFYDNIYQCGASYCTHAQNIYTCSDTITMREGADFAGDAQIKVLKYDGTNDGVIQLGTDGTLRIGDVNSCQPVLTRSEEGSICDGHVLVWDATNRCAKDGGEAVVTCEYVHCVGKECKSAACDYACIVAKCCDYYNRQHTDQMDKICCACLDKKVCEACINSYKHADTVGMCCYMRACSCAINMDALCLACAYACSDTALSCACSFASSCGHDIGTACKNAATATKANCYGNSYNCVACADVARSVELEPYTVANKRFIYVGDPNQKKNIGCNPNLWFCPTCNIMVMGNECGSALCLIGSGSCCVGGICSKLNPKIVFASTDSQCGCLQYTQYDSVHPGAGLCWMTNQAHTWFQTDCVYASKYLDSNGVALPTCGYVSTVGGQCKSASCTYASSVGTQCKSAACSFASSCGHLIGTSCKDAACSFASSCGHDIGTSCKTASCTYATSVGTQCKSAACTYANTVAFCNINTCKGLGVMGVARSTDAQCWTKAGYWAYMTTKDGPNCCWNHVMKMDWNVSADARASGISIPTYNAPQAGIHYKTKCCGGTTGWTLVPSITCVQSLGLSCRSIAEACACKFAAACAQAVVPETSTFAKCYGNSTDCVGYADQIRFRVSSNNTFYKIPFTTTITASANEPIYVDGGNVYPSYNPSTNVFCGYTVCVAQTLAVRNANGGFRLGNYCIYIA